MNYEKANINGISNNDIIVYNCLKTNFIRIIKRTLFTIKNIGYKLCFCIYSYLLYFEMMDEYYAS